MKLSTLWLAAAALAGSTVAVATPAQAQERVVVHRTTTVTHRTNRGWHARRHRVCSVRWYHHRKVRRCYWR